MRKQARQKRSAARAFDELRRARQETEHEAQESRIRNVSRRDVNEHFRAARRRAARKFLFRRTGDNFVQAFRMAEILNEQRVKIFRRELFEKRVESVRKRRT